MGIGNLIAGVVMLNKEKKRKRKRKKKLKRKINVAGMERC